MPGRLSLPRALALAGAAWLFTGCAASKPILAVAVPVSDLRAQPHTSAQPGSHDALQETQLLYGERVRLRRTQDGWAYVEALEQPEFTHARRWQGYPGWVPSSALRRWEPLRAPNIVVVEKWAGAWDNPYTAGAPAKRFALGTRLRATDVGGVLWKVELLDGKAVWLPQRAALSVEALARLPLAERRQAVVRAAALLLGDPYLWGGRSPADPAQAATGVDCSGLVNLAHRSAGIDIPRDAHEQSLRARPVHTLQPADLIFLSERHDPGRIVHVMLYAGDGQVIEGPGTGLAVRKIALTERLGKPAEPLAPGAVIDGQTLSFGSYFESQAM